jgi:hypothetical protein
MKEPEEISTKAAVFGCLIGIALFCGLIFVAFVDSNKKKEEHNPGYKIAPTTKSVDSLETI